MMRFLLLVAISLAASLCGAQAEEQPPSTGGRAIGALFDALGVRKTPPPAPDFVRDSRSEQLHYIPIGPTPEKAAKRPATEMQAVGAALDRAAAENRRKAARVRTPN